MPLSLESLAQKVRRDLPRRGWWFGRTFVTDELLHALGCSELDEKQIKEKVVELVTTGYVKK